MNSYRRVIYDSFFEELLEMQKEAMDRGLVPPMLKIADFAANVSGPALDYAKSVGAKGVMDLDDKQLVEFSRRMGLNQEALETAMPTAASLPGGTQHKPVPRTMVQNAPSMPGSTPIKNVAGDAKAGWFKNLSGKLQQAGSRMKGVMKQPGMKKGLGLAGGLGALALSGAGGVAYSRSRRGAQPVPV